ncbi:hypothetical protein RCL1_001438 [Eukaryota sp. TZLM3-RCL]
MSASEHESDLDIRNNSSASDGEELDQYISDDYRSDPELDRYEQEDLDNSEQPFESIAERRALDLDIHDKSRHRRSGGAFSEFFIAQKRVYQEEDSLFDMETVMKAALDSYDDSVPIVDIVTLRREASEELKAAQVQVEVRRQFRLFLQTFVPPNTAQSPVSHYIQALHQMVEQNSCSLSVSFTHISQFSPATAKIAEWLIDAPLSVTPLLDMVLKELTLKDFPRYPSAVPHALRVRISDLPIRDLLRNLRTPHLNKLVCIEGVVTRRSTIHPHLSIAVWTCNSCNALTQPEEVLSEADEAAPTICSACSSSSGFKLAKNYSKYSSVQRVDVQESPNTVEAGRAPRSISIILKDDLIDMVRPGQEVIVTGTYMIELNRLSKNGGFPVAPVLIDVLTIEDKTGSINLDDITQEDKRLIRELSRDPNIIQRVIASIAPNTFGLNHIKEILALALFGGVEKKTDRHRSRGDINVLLLGDPSTAKSQFLKFLEKTAPRAVFTTGKGASAVGLTATVRRDPQTKLMTLEGGAFVIADRGMCLIDEFDKMSEYDRSAIHEAMEQQTVSVSKAGIVASLNSRCSVVACANPISGRYDPSRPLLANVDLSEPILSRFDVTIILRDVVDPFHDALMASFVVNSHYNLHPLKDDVIDDVALDLGNVNQSEYEKIPHELLRKYIRYAKANCNPRLGNKISSQKIEVLYSLLRKESAQNGGQTITVRQLESILRLAEASAKIHLRPEISINDINRAIHIVISSFIDCQKVSVTKHLQKVFQKYLIESSDREFINTGSLDSSIIFEQFDKCLGKAFKQKYLQLDASSLVSSREGKVVINLSVSEFENVLKYDVSDAFLTTDHRLGESMLQKYLFEIRRKPRKNVSFDGLQFTSTY